MSKKLFGTWYNQLGSWMTLTVDENSGLTGKYHSAVGPVEDNYTLTGRFDASPSSDIGISVGWVVTWRNTKPSDTHSTTTWSGQYFDDGQERIVTHWLLTKSTKSADIWDSTRIGTDIFLRTKPSAAEIEQARALAFASPHPEDIIAATLRERAPLKSRL